MGFCAFLFNDSLGFPERNRWCFAWLWGQSQETDTKGLVVSAFVLDADSMKRAQKQVIPGY